MAKQKAKADALSVEEQIASIARYEPVDNPSDELPEAMLKRNAVLIRRRDSEKKKS